ncbi:serine hydrolase [Aquimarina brevivitae]|uniref:serine hydrolase n=1 Tax=Aquimarina brevivitae TaxID=323412 RepID=UPI001F5E9D45|nr:serine hydrolase [Aquimarina brevivitae]
MLKFFVVLLLVSCQKRTPLERVLTSDIPEIQKVMQQPEAYELQILYTTIDYDNDGTVALTDYSYQVNDSSYFYPASTVKFPIALLALEKVKALQQQGMEIDRTTPFKIEGDSLVTTLAQEITKLFAISDNDAYNRLFEFLGQEYINSKLAQKHLKGSIRHRLATASADDKRTKAVTFYKNIEPAADTHFHISSKENTLPPQLSLAKLKKGKGYYSGDQLIHAPMDFSRKNYLPLSTLHQMMKRLHFPNTFSPEEQFHIDESQQDFVFTAMKKLPYKAGYDRKEYYDSYVKFFMYGDTKENIPDHIQIVNKVGYAYGYLTETAYIQDINNDVAFILSATLHVNENQIYNDDHYEYEAIGIPFLAALGKLIYKNEVATQR